MTELKKISDVIPFQKAQDSIFSTLINRKVSRVFTYFMVTKMPWISPTHVNLISFAFSVAGIALFIHPNYYWRLLGILLLQIGFTFDCSDGEVARIKNAANAFGAWFDSVLDRFKEFLMLAALMAYWYMHQSSTVDVLIVGFLAIIGLQLVSYLREAKKSSWPSRRTAEFFIAKNIYIGTVDVTIYIVCAAVLFNIEYYVLCFFLLISIPLLYKQLRSAFKLAKKG